MRKLLLALALLVTAAGCSSNDTPPPRAREVRPLVERDLPNVLRGTVGSEVTLRGTDPALVSGYGLVVGLNGTGSKEIPAGIRAYMETEMMRMGVGREDGPMKGVNPGDLLDDPNTAVVLVQALIPPAAPKSLQFDVYVSALRGSSTTSLEGGTLWTTDLRRGIANPGGPSTQVVARAYGPIFMNPFVSPGDAATSGQQSVRGIVLGGGLVTNPLSIAMLLDNPSHARARAIASAVNSKFPKRDNPEYIARGIDEETIEINVPKSYRDRSGEFIQLLRHTRIDQTFPDEWAKRYIDALKETPSLSNELSWCLTALGDVALPFVREMYTYSEIAPRTAALQAGARLGDVLTRPYLEEIAQSGASATRANAVRLLGRLKPDQKVNAFLVRQLDSDDLDVRIAAYEALDERGDPSIRVSGMDKKFRLDQVPSSKPMIYVTQSKEPRIVVFGDDQEIQRPVVVSAWENRLLLKAMETSRDVEVLYRDYRSNKLVKGSSRPDIRSFVSYLAHRPTPEEPAPGLDMTYSEVVGALYHIRAGGGLPGDFVTEDDREALESLRSADASDLAERPELSPEGALDLSGGPVPAAALAGEIKPGDRAADPERERRRRAYVIQMPPAPPPKGAESK